MAAARELEEVRLDNGLVFEIDILCGIRASVFYGGVMLQTVDGPTSVACEAALMREAFAGADGIARLRSLLSDRLELSERGLVSLTEAVARMRAALDALPSGG